MCVFFKVSQGENNLNILPKKRGFDANIDSNSNFYLLNFISIGNEYVSIILHKNVSTY